MDFNEIKLEVVPNSVKILNISDEEYFGPNWRGYISNSKLSLLNPEQGGSPQKYKEGLGKHMKYSDSMTFGSAVHQMVLQPDEFTLAPKLHKPTAKLGLMADELYRKHPNVSEIDILNASSKVDYYKDKMNDVKVANVLEKCTPYWQLRTSYDEQVTGSKIPIYLDDKSLDKLYECLRSVDSNRQIQELLYPTDIFGNIIPNEAEAAIFIDLMAIFPDGHEVLLQFKGKIDHFAIDDVNEVIYLNDLKTTGHYTTRFWESFYKYHYYRQMAMYGFMLKEYAKLGSIENPTFSANMLLISTVPQYKSDVYRVTASQIRRGMIEFTSLVKQVAYYERYGF